MDMVAAMAAKQPKNEGRTLDAERVKALAKPPSPAWAVNQLYWQDPKAIERLLTLGERIRNRPDSSKTPICGNSEPSRQEKSEPRLSTNFP